MVTLVNDADQVRSELSELDHYGRLVPPQSCARRDTLICSVRMPQRYHLSVFFLFFTDEQPRARPRGRVPAVRLNRYNSVAPASAMRVPSRFSR
jgi:hypothetical protein